MSKFIADILVSLGSIGGKAFLASFRNAGARQSRAAANMRADARENRRTLLRRWWWC
jgi:hypothetical protein